MADLCAAAWLCLVAGVCQALDSSLESTFSKKDSASGNHLPDCLHFRAVITDKVTPTLKCKQNKQSNTANLRILEEEKQAGCENSTPNLESTFSYNAFFLSSRDLQQQVVAIHDSAQAESTFLPFVLDSSVQVDCHADKSARNDDKAQNLNESIKDSRICDEKSGFCERVQGRILGVCNRRTRDAIHDLSRKAESTSHLDKAGYAA